MAGGTWSKLSLKERPGTYINWQTTEQNIIGIAERGTVIMPLLGHNYGPAKEFITIENSSPDAQYAKLGYSVYEPPLLLVKEALKSAKTIILYIPAQGERAHADVAVDLPEPEEDEYNDLLLAKVKTTLGKKPDMTGCNLSYDRRGRTYTVTLTGELSAVKNTGIIDTLTALVGGGYALSIGGTALTDVASVNETALYTKAVVMKPGDSDISDTIKVSKDGQEQDYTIVISYPSTAPEAQQGLQDATVMQGNISATAMYGGERGNDLSFDCVANEDGGYDVTVYLDNSAVEEFEGLNTVGDLIAAGSSWITFKGSAEAELSDFSAISLTGGTSGTTNTIDITSFLDASEAIHWNTMAFPLDSKENSSLMTAVVSKIKYLREDVGKYRKAVLANYAPDYEGIINVSNGYVLSDGTVVDATMATAWVAGADAGADCITSNTYKPVEDAADIYGLLSHTEAVAAIKAGKFFFSFNESNEVVVEYDINSLVSFARQRKAKSWRKNRVLRVMDSFGESVQLNFPPNRFDNDDDGWNAMEGIGKTILKLYGLKSEGGVGAIRGIDYDKDFLVDREESHGDEVFVNVGIQPVDSAEKFYFTVTTR